MAQNIVRFDQDVQNDLDQLRSRRAELQNRLGVVDREIKAILTDLGAVMFGGGDWQGQTERLLFLRAESEALNLAVNYCDNQEINLRRFNTWAR